MSAFQEIDQLAFTQNGFLATEYGNLYQSLFNHADRHITIIETLASRPRGLGRVELVKFSGIKDGGTLTIVLRELEDSGF
ncbi:MAG TPA: ATP-binding protein, partial [Chitinophagaceae bacterium]